MKESERVDLIEQMIRTDEHYCESMNAIFDKCLEALPPDLARAGKKVICNGMAKSKAEVGDKILALMMDSPLEEEKANPEAEL